VIRFIRELFRELSLSEEQRAEQFRKRMAEAGEKYIQWQRWLLIENPQDPPQFWRWKHD
jgi:hypothetical protein